MSGSTGEHFKACEMYTNFSLISYLNHHLSILDVLFIVFNSGCYDYQFTMNQRSLNFKGTQ